MHHLRSIRHLAVGRGARRRHRRPGPGGGQREQAADVYVNDGLRQVNLVDKDDNFRLQLFLQDGKIAARSEIGSNVTTVNCFSLTGSGTTANVSNTDRIVVSGTLTGNGTGDCFECDPVPSSDGYLIDETAGAFAPGLTKEADGPPRSSCVADRQAAPRAPAPCGPAPAKTAHVNMSWTHPKGVARAAQRRAAAP